MTSAARRAWLRISCLAGSWGGLAGAGAGLRPARLAQFQHTSTGCSHPDASEHQCLWLHNQLHRLRPVPSSPLRSACNRSLVPTEQRRYARPSLTPRELCGRVPAMAPQQPPTPLDNINKDLWAGPPMPLQYTSPVSVYQRQNLPLNLVALILSYVCWTPFSCSWPRQLVPAQLQPAGTFSQLTGSSAETVERASCGLWSLTRACQLCARPHVTAPDHG